MENKENLIDAEIINEDGKDSTENVQESNTESLEVISPIENTAEDTSTENSSTENSSTEVESGENNDTVDDQFQNLNAKVDMLSATVNLINQNLIVHTRAYDQALQEEINNRNTQWNNISNNIDKLIESMNAFPENCKKHFTFIGGLTILNVVILLLNILL